jgi:hypothetical protein
MKLKIYKEMFSNLFSNTYFYVFLEQVDYTSFNKKRYQTNTLIIFKNETKNI